MAKLVFLSDYGTSGVPTNLNIDPETKESIKQTISSEFLADITKKLPERVKLPEKHPDWLRDGIIEVVNDSAELIVTFVDEGAGYTNTIGYYIYQKDRPPKKVEDIKTIYIIFPNCSKNGAGGRLLPGDSIKLPSEHKVSTVNNKHIGVGTSYVFNTGTCVGFVIFSNAYKPSTNSLNTNTNKFYSNHELNIESTKNKKYHTVLINSIDNKIIVGFEDLRRDQNSDDDFNDVVLSIKATPRSAINDYYINDTQTTSVFGTILCEDRLQDTTGLNNCYSDLIVEYKMTQKQDDKFIKEIQMEFALKYRSAIYDHEFGIKIPNFAKYSPNIKQEIYYGHDKSTVIEDRYSGLEQSTENNTYPMDNNHVKIFVSTKQALPPSGNHEHYANTHPEWEPLKSDPTMTKLIITFEKEMPIDAIKTKMPFIPYLVVWKSGKVGEIPDLSYILYADKKYRGANTYRLDTVCKLLVLEGLTNYRNPRERFHIYDTYPEFEKFLESNCTKNLKWYNNPRPQYLNTLIETPTHKWSI
jgi:LruC domain-containing protein